MIPADLPVSTLLRLSFSSDGEVPNNKVWVYRREVYIAKKINVTIF